MAKLTLSDIASGYGSTTKHNANNDLIEAAVENTLSRDGTAPNEMEANLDMNSYRILNLPNAVANQEPVTLAQAAVIAGVDNPLTQESVGAVLYPRTAAEVTAAVTPTNYYYEPGDYRRITADSPDADGNVTFDVGSGGDFVSINEAMSVLFKPPANGVQIVLNLLSGFAMAEQVIVMDGQNFGWMKIVAEDAETTITRSALTVKASDYNETFTGNLPIRYPAFFAYSDSTLPTLGCLFAMDSSGNAALDYDGVLLHGGSFVTVLEGAGVKNVASNTNDSRGLHVAHGSVANGWGSVWSGCDIGIRVSNASIVSARECVASGCLTAVSVGSGATVNIQGSDLTACTYHSIYAIGTADVQAYQCDCTGTGAGGTSSTYSAIYAEGTANVTAAEVDLDGTGVGIYALQGATVNALSGSFVGCKGYGIYASGGAHVFAESATITGAGASVALDAVRAANGAYVVVRAATITGAAASGVVSDGSIVVATGATLTGNDNTGSEADIEITNGGLVFADGAITTNGGGTTISLADTSVSVSNVMVPGVGMLICDLTGFYPAASSGATGGTGSGGAGNQYIALTINGTTYKVLHDGTV